MPARTKAGINSKKANGLNMVVIPKICGQRCEQAFSIRLHPFVYMGFRGLAVF